MSIFRDLFNVKQSPIFTGLRFGFGSSSAPPQRKVVELTIEFVAFGAGGSTSRPPSGSSGKGGRSLATYKMPSAVTLHFRAGGNGVLTPTPHAGGGGGSSSVHIGDKSGIANALLYAGGGAGSADNVPPPAQQDRGHAANTPYSSSSSGGVAPGDPGGVNPSPGSAPSGGGGGNTSGGNAGDGSPGHSPGTGGGNGEAGGAHRGGFGGPVTTSYFPPVKASQDATDPSNVPLYIPEGLSGNQGGWPDGGWGGGKGGVVEGGGGGGGGYYGGGGGGVSGNIGAQGGGGSSYAASTGTINGFPVTFVSCQLDHSAGGEAFTSRDADPSSTAPSGVQHGVSAANSLGGFGWIAYRVNSGSWNSIPGENNTPNGSDQYVNVPLEPFAPF